MAEAHTLLEHRLERMFPPRQSRSRETLARILEATEALLAAKSFDEVSVSDIVRHAASSVGSFYSRFPDKEALLLALHDKLTDDAVESIDLALDPERWVGASVSKIVTESTGFLVRFYRAREGLYRALLARPLHDPSLRARGAPARRHLARRLTHLLLERRREIGHSDPELATEFLLQIAFSVMEQRVLSRGAPLGRLQLSDEQVAAELVRVMLAYLEV